MIIIILCVCLYTVTLSPIDDNKKYLVVCIGTNVGLQLSGGSERHQWYQDRYKGCAIVNGNLEVTHLEEQDNYDLSFLEDIEEVTGYVLIVNVFATYLPLGKLRIIRGWSLFHLQYGLYVGINYKDGSQSVGLQELRLTSLGGEYCFRHCIWYIIMIIIICVNLY